MSYKARTISERFWEKVYKSDECWVWTAAKYPSGYGLFVSHKGESPEGAHRVSYRLTFGKIPKGKQILHRCDNRPCVLPDHLYAGTQSENMHDKIRRGRWKYTPRNQRGENNPNSIISDARVAKMLAEIESGKGPISVARKYGISYKTLWAIRKRKSSDGRVVRGTPRVGRRRYYGGI